MANVFKARKLRFRYTVSVLNLPEEVFCEMFGGGGCDSETLKPFPYQRHVPIQFIWECVPRSLSILHCYKGPFIFYEVGGAGGI